MVVLDDTLQRRNKRSYDEMLMMKNRKQKMLTKNRKQKTKPGLSRQVVLVGLVALEALEVSSNETRPKLNSIVNSVETITT
jgi:hypothetical protein